MILRNFYKQEYFKEIETLLVNGNLYSANISYKIEKPESGGSIKNDLIIEGWAVDLSDFPGSKIDYILVYLDGLPQDDGKFLSKCFYGKLREDIGGFFGDQYKYSGFYCEIDIQNIENGFHDFYILLHSSNFGWRHSVLKLKIDN